LDRSPTSPERRDRWPFGSQLFWRLCAGYAVLIVVVTGVVGILIETRERAAMLRDVRAQLAAGTAYLRDTAAPWLLPGAPGTSDPSGLQARVTRLGAESGARLTVIRADGTVIADSSLDPAKLDDHSARPEFQQALAQGSGSIQRFSRTSGEDMLYAALRVPPEGPALGVVRTGLPVALVDQRIWELRGLVLIGAALAALVGLVLGLFFARRLSAPVAEVIEAVEAISRGGYGHVESPRAGDEIGRIALAVNRMSEELRERLGTITADRNKVLAILGSMVEGVVAVDGEERVVHMNQVARRLLGAPPAGSVGRRIWEVTRAVEIPRILEEARQRGEASGTAEVVLDGSAERRVIELAASPLLDASGLCSGAVVVLHDVTELRRLEQVRRDFVANVSHELKTPLTAIRGLVETLIDDQAMEPATARRFALKIRDQAVRLSALVTDLLTLARVEAADDSRERRALDLRGPLRECAARFAPLCAEKSVRLALEIPERPIHVNADEEDLRQIAGNLLDNAIKYTPSGGSVALRVQPDGEEVLIEVADTGIGIEPRHQDRIFERFYRVDKARSRELGGTGLGLSIVKHQVLALEGSISLASTPGQGSSFRVRLPLVS
jgi:two-component system phosphate regulon sensor histidine kinase PhoR